MRLSVHHLTRFEFDQPSRHSIHDVRLQPLPASGQRVLQWRIDGPGKRSEWTDGHGNAVTTFSVVQSHDAVEIEVHGLYEYNGGDQWLRYGETPTLPPPFWLRNTGMARHDESFDPLIEGLGDGAAESTQRVMVLHEVMARVGRALGAGPLCHDEAHARRVADLTVYLRQHHAERNLAELGALAAEAGTSW